MIIQIIGLPGSGKTTLAIALADRINAIHFTPNLSPTE
jgi:adenylate kinase family enzyme